MMFSIIKDVINDVFNGRVIYEVRSIMLYDCIPVLKLFVKPV